MADAPNWPPARTANSQRTRGSARAARATTVRGTAGAQRAPHGHAGLPARGAGWLTCPVHWAIWLCVVPCAGVCVDHVARGPSGRTAGGPSLERPSEVTMHALANFPHATDPETRISSTHQGTKALMFSEGVLVIFGKGSRITREAQFEQGAVERGLLVPRAFRRTQSTKETGVSEFKTDLQKEYCQRRDRLAVRFPAASRFLLALEALCRDDQRFHLGTAQNLHLYVSERFLAYVKMDKLASSEPVLRFSSEPNVQIKHGTRSDPARVLPRPLNTLVMDHRGYSAGWATHNHDEGAFAFMPGTPAAFFDAVVELVRQAA
jgi:hypothetical protein